MRVVTPSRLVCAGCGTEAREHPERGEYPFRCPGIRPNDNIDHILAPTFARNAVAFPSERNRNPFITYRSLSHSWHFALARGMDDERYVALVRALDREIAGVEERDFEATPFERSAALAARAGFSTGGGGIWVKDETNNVSGSHKARHLMGIMIYLKVLDALGLRPASEPALAIASCGNAALAAAIVARAGRRHLRVFIPPDAPRSVVERLIALGVETVECRRQDGLPGDPCYLRFQQSVAGGDIPFCCQGSANGLTIEGGKTLGFEMVSTLGGTPLDAVVVQVGGGALASSLIQAFAAALALQAISRLPRFYAVQTRGAFPLKRAYDRISSSAVRGDSQDIAAALRYAATHRREFMWPWEEEPRSIARGILDDETYDWLAVVKGMLESGGAPVVVDEDELAGAYALAREATGINVDHTGAAGLAGLTQLLRTGKIGPRERVAVIFSGVERG